MCTSATCAATERIRVIVEHTGDDDIGREVAFELKDAIKGSSSFLIADGYANAALVVRLSTIDVEIPKKGVLSAISVSIAADHLSLPMLGYLVNAFVAYCGRNSTRSCARSYLVDIDQAAEEVKSRVPTIYDGMRGAP